MCTKRNVKKSLQAKYVQIHKCKLCGFKTKQEPTERSSYVSANLKITAHYSHLGTGQMIHSDSPTDE